MQPINVSYYRNRAYQKKKSLAAFLKKLTKKPPVDLLKKVKAADKEVWQEMSCIACANCCKTMTPTWKKSEIRKVATFVGMDYETYYREYIKVDEDNGDLVNQTTPCQHLNLKTNMCSVYEVRPHDCKHFPHFIRKDFTDQTSVYTENLHRCPATLLLIEKLEKNIAAK
ncbi:MAG: YkgJ family cysteine cluster protein [Chitinophagales bacterium]|nr:YkgJ family cysteine cluster protein [Chitinophagales bacterium]